MAEYYNNSITNNKLTIALKLLYQSHYHHYINISSLNLDTSEPPKAVLQYYLLHLILLLLYGYTIIVIVVPHYVYIVIAIMIRLCLPGIARFLFWSSWRALLLCFYTHRELVFHIGCICIYIYMEQKLYRKEKSLHSDRAPAFSI